MSNNQRGLDFENTAFEYFKTKENVLLKRNFEINLGVEVELEKTHRFDLGDNNEKIIVECKLCTWRNGDDVPSAKMTNWNEAMFYFKLAPKEYKKIFFVSKAYSPKKSKTLLRYYIEKYYHFIPNDVIFYEYSDGGDCEKYTFEKIKDIIKNK
jgi:hypothetical protein